jgi:type IV pilus assembly protein PilY1
MIGLPIPYPSDVGSIAQKIFIGDADGTMWRIDVSDPIASNWKARLYQDLFSGGTGLEGQPVSVPPIASLDPFGNVILNVATGDQENLIASNDYNMVYSLAEGKPSGSLANSVQAQVQWYKKLTGGERVTGPMAVFDSTLYFASYVPEPLANVCGAGSKQYVWGLDYFQPKDALDRKQGGRYKWGGVAPFTDKADFTQPPKGALIPGVAIRGTLNCVDTSGAGFTDYFGATQFGVNNSSGMTYSLDINVAAPKAAGGITKVSQTLSPPRTPTIIDSWALVVD